MSNILVDTSNFSNSSKPDISTGKASFGQSEKRHEIFSGDLKKMCIQGNYALLPVDTLSPEKPNFSLVELIFMAISNSRNSQASLADIYSFLIEHFQYFRDAEKKGWQNSVRHTLSFYKYFTCSRPDGRKGGFWSLSYPSVEKIIDKLLRPRLDFVRLESIRKTPHPDSEQTSKGFDTESKTETCTNNTFWNGPDPGKSPVKDVKRLKRSINSKAFKNVGPERKKSPMKSKKCLQKSAELVQDKRKRIDLTLQIIEKLGQSRLAGKRQTKPPLKYRTEKDEPKSLSNSQPGQKNKSKTLGTSKKSQGVKRIFLCGNCQGCLTPNCGDCVYCKDMPSFGGPGVLRRPCTDRQCKLQIPAKSSTIKSINNLESPKEVLALLKGRVAFEPDQSFTNKKPDLTYGQMISLAIENSEEKKLSLNDIYESIMTQYPFYREIDTKGWQNSLRYRLSSSKAFIRIRDSSAPRKRGVWTINPNYDLELIKKRN